MNAFPTADSTIAPIATGPMPQRAVVLDATTAPMNDDAPPTPATTPRTAGLSWRSSSTNRKNVAPKMPHSAASAICAPTNARRIGRAPDDGQADPDLGQDGFAVLGFGRRRLGLADRPEQDRRHEVGHRVDGDGDRRREDLDEEPADPEGHELGGGSARGEGAVRVDQALALDDRRQVGVVGGIEERRQDRGQPGDHQELRERQDAERERDRHGTEQDRPTEVRPDEDRPSPQPVDPGAGDEPEDERRTEVEAAQDRDLDRARAEHEDGHQRQRDPGDERAEDRDGRRRPDADERRVAPERGGERIAHEGGA